jgi:hypothetical protein
MRSTVEAPRFEVSVSNPWISDDVSDDPGGGGNRKSLPALKTHVFQAPAPGSTSAEEDAPPGESVAISSCATAACGAPNASVRIRRHSSFGPNRLNISTSLEAKKL